MLLQIPILGTLLPNMGKNYLAAPSAIADALFSPVQQRVLALLFSDPSREFRTAEILERVDGGVGAAHRQLVRLADAGILHVTRSGNQKLYRANDASPVFAELRGLVVKTIGLVDPILQALQPATDEITAAFVYGSMAAGTARSGSDIDLMIVSDTLRYPRVMELLEPAQARLARPVNPTLLTRRQWKARVDDDSFVSRVLSKPVLWVVGSADALK